jgi:spermidine/putrescine transport system ATP-binding protein
LREQMQVELKHLQSRLGTTFIMVTHDQTEALSISDRIAVLNRGRIEQIATPAELYDAPATRFVADFIGSMNVLEGEILETTAEAVRVEAGAMIIEVPADRAALTARVPGAAVLVCIRPEELSVLPFPADGAVPAQIVSTIFHGPTLRVFAVLPGGEKLMIDAPRRNAEARPRTGTTIYVCPLQSSGRILSTD